MLRAEAPITVDPIVGFDGTVASLKGKVGEERMKQFFSVISCKDSENSRPHKACEFPRELAEWIVPVLTGDQLSEPEKRFLMAHLGLREIRVYNGEIDIYPAAYKTVALFEGSGNVDRELLTEVAGAVVLFLAKKPTETRHFVWFGGVLEEKNSNLRVNLVSCFPSDTLRLFTAEGELAVSTANESEPVKQVGRYKITLV